MTGERTASWHRFTGLSARLLLLTTYFVMLSEVFIYAPPIGRFRLVYLEERIAAAHLASLALEVPTDNMVSAGLRHELLNHAGSYGIVLRRPASKALMLSRNMPPKIDATYDIGDHRFFALIMEAFLTLAGDGDRILRITGISPKNPRVIVETVISEAPLREAMLGYSARIMALSIAISLMTAVLVYLSLQWLFVRPMRAITASMVAFQQDPEDGRRVMVPGRRSDEIGVARRELAGMQEGLRAALQQKARLVALGTAVTKINHDLRNILATARLVSDHVESSEDPNVRRIAPTLLGAIDRAITLCSQTLGFAQEGTPAPRLSRFPLALLMAEVAAEASGLQSRTVAFDNRIAAGFYIFADREQMFRVLSNLVRNAFEAGAGKITAGAAAAGSAAIIEIADDGHGLPPKLRENLFQPFAGTGRVGGIGLAIARDLLRGHGGSIELVSTGADGTVFRLILPMDRDDVVYTRMPAERPPGREGDAP